MSQPEKPQTAAEKDLRKACEAAYAKATTNYFPVRKEPRSPKVHFPRVWLP